MGCCQPLSSRLLSPTPGSVDGRNPGRLVRRHTEAPSRVSLANGPHLPSEPGGKLAQIPADRAGARARLRRVDAARRPAHRAALSLPPPHQPRSEEHTSELQSPCNLVCRLLLEKKKKK